MSTDVAPVLISVTEAAQIVGVNRATLREWLAAGTVPEDCFIRTGQVRPHYRVKVKPFMAWLESGHA